MANIISGRLGIRLSFVSTTVFLCLLLATGSNGRSSTPLSCQFSIGGSLYDLCPLLQADHALEPLDLDVSTPPTSTMIRYDVGLGGSLERDPWKPEHEHCPKGTWICMTVTDSKPGLATSAHVLPVAGNIVAPPGADPTLYSGLSPTAKSLNDSAIDVTLNGGQYNGKPQRAIISFLCSQQGSGLTASPPDLDSGNHLFSWRTPHACPSFQSNSETEPSPVSATPPPPIESTGDLLPPTPISGRRTRSVVFISLITICTLSLLGYGMYTCYPRLFRRTKSRILPRRFRVGERRLLLWAEEDMMVNAEEDLDLDDVHEDILPLTVSPRKLGSSHEYGSTRRN